MDRQTRAYAIFDSILATDSTPAPGEIRDAAEAALRLHRDAEGCVAAAATAFGEDPVTAARRMLWASRRTASDVRLGYRSRMTTGPRRARDTVIVTPRPKCVVSRVWPATIYGGTTMYRKALATVAVAALTASMALGLPTAAQAAPPNRTAKCVELFPELCNNSNTQVGRLCEMYPWLCFRSGDGPRRGGPDFLLPSDPDLLEPWESWEPELLPPEGVAVDPVDLLSGHGR